jgi:hypothetical protein
MNTRLAYILSALLLLLCAGAARAQEDLGLWTALSFEKKFTRKFSGVVEQNLRLNENISRLDQTFTNFALSYRFGKHLKLTGFYRFSQKHKPEGISLRHRVYGDIALRFKLKPAVLTYRLRLQSQVQDVQSSELGSIPESTTRNRLELKLDFDRRIRPYFNAELFYQINDPRNSERNNYLNLIRYTGGFEYEINKKNYMGLYYLFQQGLNFSSDREYIIGVDYGFVF